MSYDGGMTKQEKALEIYGRLHKDNPHPKVELKFTTPFELLVATMLAAQSTDKNVNTVTPALFKKYPTIKSYADATPEEIDGMVSRVNFHFTKAKHIHEAAKMIMDKYHGEVPRTMAELDALPGVARKTANVVLGSAFGIPAGIVIDTHGIRLANKFGLTASKDPVKIEQDLMKLIPQKNWIEFGHLLTLHGRYVCKARKHSCNPCPLGDLCPEYGKK